MLYRYALIFLLCFLFGQVATGQRVLLIEKINSPHTEKLYIGNYIEYRLVDEEGWQRGKIEDLRDDRQLIVMADRYVDIAQVEALRTSRPWTGAIGTMLMTFGVSWSGFAAIGTATDGDPNTSYRWSDAAVTGTSVGLGLLIYSLGGRKMRFGEGKRYRLRILDISF